MLKSSMEAASYKRHIYTTLSAVLLLATASSASAATGLSDTDYCQDGAQDQTPSYTYQSDLQQTMNCMLTQLEPYQQTDKTPHQRYSAYKAQAWLTYAIHQGSINSYTSDGAYAAHAAEFLLQSLKNDTVDQIDLFQDLPDTSALMRPDLWATLGALKDSNGIASAPREMAFSEIALIWAATNQCERGWRESSPHFRMADRWLEQAREAYVNANDSESNLALQPLIVRYFEQYSPLDMAGKDTCQGQPIESISTNLSPLSAATINMPTSTATYNIIY